MQQFNLRIDCEEPIMENSTIGAIPIGGSQQLTLFKRVGSKVMLLFKKHIFML